MKEKQIRKDIFYITGMTCTGCAANVEKTLTSAQGVKESKVNFAASTVMITYDPAVINPQELQLIIRRNGYELWCEEESQPDRMEAIQQQDYQKLKHNTIWASLLTSPVFVIGMFFMHMPYREWIMLLFTIPVLFIFGQSFYTNACQQLKHRRANMDTLVAISTGIAFLFSLFNTLWPHYWTTKGWKPMYIMKPQQ